MAKLDKRHFFTLEYEDEQGQEVVLKGQFKDKLKKPQEKEIKDIIEAGKADDDILIKLYEKEEKQLLDKKIAEKDGNYELVKTINSHIDTTKQEIKDHQDKINTNDYATQAIKKRFHLSVVSEQKDQMIQCCEDYSYEYVMTMIFKDIDEGKQKENKN